MSISLGSAFGEIRLSAEGVHTGVLDAQRALAGFQSSFSALNVAIGVMAADLAKQIASIGVNLASMGVDFDAMKQQAEIAFTTMLGSGEKARTFLDVLAQFAASTPFEFPELVDASKKLLAFGIDAQDIIPTMTRLGDLSAGLGINVNDLADIYGKAKVQGRLFAEDINQLTGRGIPIIGELAHQFGVTEDAVRDLVKDGKIGFPQLEKAIKSMTAQGSKFGGMMEKQSKSFSGLLSTVKDTFSQVSGKVMQPFFDLMTDGLQQIVDFTSRPEFTAWVDEIARNVESAATMIGEFIGGIQKGEGVFDSLARTLQMFKNTSDIGNGLAEVLSKLNQLGDWVSHFSQYVTSGNLDAAWAMISNTLKGWSTQVWDWLTGKGGAIDQAKTKLQEFANGIGTFITDNGPKAWTQLQAWATDFWSWLQLQDAEGGIWSIGKARLFLLANSIGNELETRWKLDIAPQLDKWATEFWNWMTGDHGAMDQIGAKMIEWSSAFKQWAEDNKKNENLLAAGRAMRDAILSVFGIVSEGGKSDPQTTVAMQGFAASLKIAASNVKDAFVAIGRDILIWIGEGIFGAGEWTVENFFKGIDYTKGMVKPLPIGGSGGSGFSYLAPYVAPNFPMPAGGTPLSAAQQQAINLNMTVVMDGQPVANIFSQKIYADITTLFSEAMNPAAAQF